MFNTGSLVRHYRCRNPRCRHQWARTEQGTLMNVCFGTYWKENSKCPRCGKPAEPNEVHSWDSDGELIY